MSEVNYIGHRLRAPLARPIPEISVLVAVTKSNDPSEDRGTMGNAVQGFVPGPQQPGWQPETWLQGPSNQPDPKRLIAQTISRYVQDGIVDKTGG